MQDVTCLCGHSVRVQTVENNVGKLAEQSGFLPVFMSDGHLAWLCDNCAAAALDAVRALRAVFGDAVCRVSLYSLNATFERREKLGQPTQPTQPTDTTNPSNPAKPKPSSDGGVL